MSNAVHDMKCATGSKASCNYANTILAAVSGGREHATHDAYGVHDAGMYRGRSPDVTSACAMTRLEHYLVKTS